MQVLQIYANNPLRNYSYILYAANHECVVIDPFNAEQIIEVLNFNKLLPQVIINTHQHHDHICGNDALVKEFNIKILDLSITKNFSLGPAILTFHHTPGHTLDHYSISVDIGSRPYCLFSGDTLFHAGVGNCKHGGHVEVLYQTIRNIYSKFSDEYILYPGHDYIENNLKFCRSVNAQYPLMVQSDQNRIINLKQEREMNPFLNEDLLQRLLVGDTSLDTDKKRFLKLRSLRDSW